MDTKIESQTNEDMGDPLCPFCVKIVSVGADFCQHCGAPIGQTTMFDPIKSIRFEGFFLKKLAESEERPIFLFIAYFILGMIAFFPLLPLVMEGVSWDTVRFTPLAVIGAVLIWSLIRYSKKTEQQTDDNEEDFP